MINIRGDGGVSSFHGEIRRIGKMGNESYVWDALAEVRDARAGEDGLLVI